VKYLKIAIFHPRFDRIGGAELFIVKIAEELRKRGHKVDIYAIRVNPIFKGIKQLSRLASCKIFHNLAIDFVGINLLGWNFLKVLKKDNYDIINPHHYPAPLVSIALKNLGFTVAKVVWMCHGPKGLLYYKDKSYLGFSRFESKIMHYLVSPIRLIDKWSIRSLDAIISNSKTTQLQVKDIYGRGSHVVNPGIDPDIFNPQNTDTSEYLTNKKCLLAVGRLVAEKNFNFLIRVFKKVVDIRSDVVLRIIGDGPEKENLSYLIQNLNLEKHVQLLPSVSQQDLAKFYGACDLFVHPMAKYESWGMVLLEAMAMEKPVVAINSEGPREIVIDGQTGYLVNYSVSQFVQRIIELLNFPEKARNMGKEGRKKVLGNFCWENSAQKIEEVFYKTRLEDDN